MGVFFFFFFNNLLFIYLFLYLFLAVLGLRLCARAFSSCRKRGPLFIAVRGPPHYRGLSCCGAQAPDAQYQLWLTGLVAPRHVGSSQTRARTRVPCISRQILNHCATREAWEYSFFLIYLSIYLIYLFIYLWLPWVFVAACGLSLVAASVGYSSLRCVGISLWWLLLRSTGSRHVGFSSCGARA